MLARATVTDFGKETASGLDLTVDDRLVWVIWDRDIDLSFLPGGPCCPDPSTTRPPRRGDAVYIVDATSGQSFGSWTSG
jgi:hypothetical protein